jgi:hypothetical protein
MGEQCEEGLAEEGQLEVEGRRLVLQQGNSKSI